MINTKLTQRDFAVQLEKNILTELTVQLDKCPESLRPVILELVSFQSKFCTILLENNSDSGECNVPNNPPLAVDAEIAPDETVWQLKVDDYATAADDEIANHYIPLWTATNAFEKSAAFYRQCAANTVNPAGKMVWLSMAEVKKMAARRAESALRICINRTWKQLGFCPFSWN